MMQTIVSLGSNGCHFNEKKNKIEIMQFPCYDINKMGIYTMESSEIKVTTNEAPNNTD